MANTDADLATGFTGTAGITGATGITAAARGTRSLLTMQDIANLARVSRPAVSQWRKRDTIHGRRVPFPSPHRAVDAANPVELFDADAVIDWLRDTGRGNNPEFFDHAPAIALPEQIVAPTEASAQAAHAAPPLDESTALVLLTLRAESTKDLFNLSPEDLARLAFEADPDDYFLQREIVAALDGPAMPAASEAPAIASAAHVSTPHLRFIDNLFAASYGPADALARLDATRLARRHDRRGLADALLPVVSAMIEGCVAFAGTPFTLATDTPEFLSVIGSAVDSAACTGLESDDRDILRRAHLLGMTARPTAASTANRTNLFSRTSQAPPTIHALSLHGLSGDATLTALDEAALNLAPGDFAVVVGSARFLCERLPSGPSLERARILRESTTADTGPLAAALRLPRGWWKEAHARATGVWLLAGAGGIASPYVADLVECASNPNLPTDAHRRNGTHAPIDPEQLGSDVSGILRTVYRGDSSRSFRYVTSRRLSVIMTGEAVVPAGAHAMRFGAAGEDRAARVQAATLVTAREMPGFDALVTRAPGSIQRRTRSLGQLIDEGTVQRINGARVRREHADEAGTVPVVRAGGETPNAPPATTWGSASKAIGYTAFHLDPFDAESRYSRSARTEPGDVVFSTHPPAAFVDETGGAIVLSPSRILRIPGRAAGTTRTAAANGTTAKTSTASTAAPTETTRPTRRTLGPYSLAEQINAQTTTEHLAWTIAEAPADQAEQLETTLRNLAEYRTELTQRLSAASTLSAQLTAGIADGTARLASAPSAGAHTTPKKGTN